MTDPSPTSSSVALPEGNVTILFTDVEGSTDLRTREGDDVATTVMRTHERLLRDELLAHGGHEAGFSGDGFMVVFASTRRAVDCAIAIQRSFAEHNRSAEYPILVRMGLNAGEVQRDGAQFYGTAINAAARVSAKAVGGQILVSQVVKDLLSGIKELSFLDRGPFTLKGFPEKWRLFEVPWREGDEAEAVPAPRPEPRAQAAHAMEETYPRPGGPLVGRAAERAAITEALDAAAGGQIRVLAVEGEAGIGKTRLLEAAIDAGKERGFDVVMVAADEELRGPFLLLRTMLSSVSLEKLADRAGAREALEAARDAVWGRGAAETGLPPAEQLLRIYDIATFALRQIATAQPLALLFDDIQWADEDSLKLVRYIVRTSAGIPLFIMLAHRPDAVAAVGAATTIIADLERMRMARRLSVPRLTREETRDLLSQIAAAPVSAECAATLHERGEGVPFFIVEFAQAFRDAGLFQIVDGHLEVSPAARSTVPSSVQILIERRLAHLPPETRELLGDAAVSGRRFRVDTLARIEKTVTGETVPLVALLERLETAVEHTLVIELPESAAHDYSFTHDEIRAALIAGAPRARRRGVHAALLEILAEAGDGTAQLPALAFHALEAGDAERGAAYSIEAARAALESFAPEAALRAVDAARAAPTSAAHRAELLRLRDDALNALERPDERLATLADLAAIASASGDEALEREVRLRRTSALRLAGDHDQAADLARELRADAASRGDAEAELAACLELGQASMRAPLGETFSPSNSEADLDATREAYERAAALAEQLGDERSLAAVKRELGVVSIGGVRAFVLMMLAEDPRLLDDPESDPRAIPQIREGFDTARALIDESLAIYERLGDKRGTMSALIALAYSGIIDDTSAGHAGRLEQIRRLMGNLHRLTSETERAESQAHMLYSIHVYARGHGPPDLALKRGVETFEAARALPQRGFDLFAAGGVALVYAQLGDFEQADAWLDRAGAVALTIERFRTSRLLETWRGLVRAAAGDADGVRTHLERALTLASEGGSPAGRFELLATIGQEGARIGADTKDEELLTLAERRANEALELSPSLPASEAQWPAMAHAALAQVALSRGDRERAHSEGRVALAEFLRTRQVFPYIFPELRLLIARALEGEDDEDVVLFRKQCAHDLQGVAQQTRDDTMRARWLNQPVVAELVRLVGTAESVWHMSDLPEGISERDVELLRRVLAGETNREIAGALDGGDEDAIARELDAVFAKVGAGDRDQASAAAVRMGIA